jgi:hypothetical protein
MRQHVIVPVRPAMRVAVGAMLMAGFIGCAAPAQLTSVWTEPGYSQSPPTNVLVIALRKDPVRRRQWEDAFVTALTRRGVGATTSYTRWQDAPPDTQQVIDANKDAHYDGILSLVRLEDQEVTKTIPGQVRQQTTTYLDRWGRAYTRYREIQEPDQLTTERVLGFQSDLWRTTATDGRLVWSGTVRVNESATSSLIRDAVEKGIMPGLEKSGIVPKPGSK